MVIRDTGGGGRHRSAATVSSSAAYRLTGSKSVKTADTGSTRVVRVTQTSLKKTRKNGKSKSKVEQPKTKSILIKKSGGKLRRKDSKTSRAVTFDDKVASESRYVDDYSSILSDRSDYSTIASEREYSYAQCNDTLFSLGTLPAFNGWGPPDLALPSFHDATRNMNAWLNASPDQVSQEAVPITISCNAAAAAASIASSPTNAEAATKDHISTSQPASSVGQNPENEVVATSAPKEDSKSAARKLLPIAGTARKFLPIATSAPKADSEGTARKLLPIAGKPPLHPMSAQRCPPSPTRSIVTPAEPKYGNFQQDEASLQESIEVSEATPKAGNAANYHYSTCGISLSSGASDATPGMENAPFVIEVPSIIIANENENEGSHVDTMDPTSLSSQRESSNAPANPSNRNSQNSSPSLEKGALGESHAERPDQEPSASPASLDNDPPVTQPTEASASCVNLLASSSPLASASASPLASVEGKLSPSPPSSWCVFPLATGNANQVKDCDAAHALSEQKEESNAYPRKESEELKIASPKYAKEIIDQMDKPLRPNQHKRSISLPKYFDRFQRYQSPAAAAEMKVDQKPTCEPTIGDVSVQIGDKNTSEAVAEVFKEAKKTAGESVINIHVHLNPNEVKAAANSTNSDTLTAAEVLKACKTEATDPVVNTSCSSDEERVEEKEENSKTEVPVVEIKESRDDIMGMDELALLSTKQCIMECKDPLSSKNPDPVIKKIRRQPRKSPGCSENLGNRVAQCIRYFAEGDTSGGQIFNDLFSCAIEDGTLEDNDFSSLGSNGSSAWVSVGSNGSSDDSKESKNNKKKRHKPTREDQEVDEDTASKFDSEGLSFQLAANLPGSDQNRNEDNESRHREEYGSRDSDWEQDTFVVRRDDSSSIDSEDGDKWGARESRHTQKQHHHRHKKMSSSHPGRRSKSQSRSRSKIAGPSGPKSSRSRSRLRSKSRPKSSERKERSTKDSKSTHATWHRRLDEEENSAIMFPSPVLGVDGIDLDPLKRQCQRVVEMGQRKLCRSKMQEDGLVVLSKTQNRKAPPSKHPGPDERPLSSKRNRVKDHLRLRSDSWR